MDVGELSNAWCDRQEVWRLGGRRGDVESELVAKQDADGRISAGLAGESADRIDRAVPPQPDSDRRTRPGWPRLQRDNGPVGMVCGGGAWADSGFLDGVSCDSRLDLGLQRGLLCAVCVRVCQRPVDG